MIEINFKKVFLYSLILTFFSNTICYSNINEEVFKNNTSSFILYQVKDSLFHNEYNEINSLYKKQDYITSLKFALGFLEKVKTINNPELLHKSYLLIADIYSKTNNHKKALNYYKKSLDILVSSYLKLEKQSIFSTNHFSKTYLRIGSSFQKQKKIDSAKYYYNKSIAVNSLDNETLNYKAISYTNLSGLFELDSLYDIAKSYALKAIEIHSKRNDKVNQANALNNLGNIYLSQQGFSKAKETYLKGIDLIDKDNTPNAVRAKANLYYNLAWAMRNLKDYKAYDFQERSYEIEDGLRDKEIRTMIETVTAKYNVADVKKAAELKRAKTQRTTWILGIASLLVIVSLLYFLNFYKLKQKNLGLKLSQKELIQKQSIEKIKSEAQIKILNATLDGKESERKQIAETLHDSVSTLLSSATLHLQATRKQFNGSTPLEIDKTQKIITEASQKIRDLSHTLVSSVLLKFGLNFALKDMAEKYSNSAITIKTELNNLRRYQQGFEIKAHNIIQEFVNNVLKHSNAKNATVFLEEKEDKLFLRIEDDGQGFNINEVTNKDGLGINQIDARIQMMKGKFVIESSPNKGTTIIVELPIVEKEPVNYV